MCPIVNYKLVSLTNIVTMEDDWELVRKCQIGNLTNLCLGLLMSLLDTNMWISIFKWIRNEDSKFNINCAVKQRLQHSLIPLFLVHPVHFAKTYAPMHKFCACFYSMISLESDKIFWLSSFPGGYNFCDHFNFWVRLYF